jgi:zinc transport system substrate-binding protein
LLTLRIILMKVGAVVVAAVLALSGCAGAQAADRPTDGRLSVIASFYPLEYAAERVGGDRVDVADLTKPGAEPHDLELSPRQVASVVDADLVVYLRGFQPSVDGAVDLDAADRAFDATPAARLDRELTDEQANGRVGTGVDPHFWLDPTRLADVGDALARRFATIDPAHAADYEQRADGLRRDLEALDAQFRSGLAHCATRYLVTGHQAFGYLAARYGLTQIGITGLNPEAEPDAATLAQVADVVRANHVRTVYAETLVSPAIARTVAAETGAATAVLDPIEGLTDESAAQDYLGVLRANLATLRSGQECS